MREKTIYEKIAEKYNTTPEEVRREMQIAIDAGFVNPDPAVQEEQMCIRDRLAESDEKLLESHFGKIGNVLWAFANGWDEDPVCKEGYDCLLYTSLPDFISG